jgi:cytochrome c-type biogenesis protein CcmF
MAALCAVILPVFGVTNIMANVGFSICTFTAAAIIYELWRGMSVRHGHGEPYPVALYMLFNRYRQRYGGYIVHLGMVMLTLGIIGSQFFQQQTDATLKPGQDMSIGGYRFTFLGNTDDKESSFETIQAQVQIWRGSQLVGYVYPGRTTYNNYPQQPTSEISINTFDLNDVYVFLADWQGASQATIRVFINPLVSLIWLGGLLMLLGGIICWWPQRRAALSARGVKKKQKRAIPQESSGVADRGAIA